MSAHRDRALRSLAVLVGTWRVSGTDGGERGSVTYRWMEGGRFLIQEVDLADDGDGAKGVEYIGFDTDTGTLRSHFFGQSGEILEYTYEVAGDTLTIWFGDRSSPAKFEGRFNADFTVNTGRWVWPGGGYASTMVKV
ncbi:hypothetical protein [Micromonospora echinaurantiaca]|uniref:hypothetical protein n=1 Tax=Micromonospora echinaurantiaca TaxID=47857 RepID=UPI003421EC7D